MLLTPYSGGMRNIRPTLISTRWHLIISWFPVSILLPSGVCIPLLSFYIATSVDVKCLFSYGHLVLSYTCSWLSVLSTCALLYVSSWSHSGLVWNEDIKAVVKLGDIDAQQEVNKLGNIQIAN